MVFPFTFILLLIINTGVTQSYDLQDSVSIDTTYVSHESETLNNEDRSEPVGMSNILPEEGESELAHDRAKNCYVTNVFYDTPVREILTAMAAQCFVNIISDETVTGILTVELEDIPLEGAMRRVLTPFGLTYRWLDGYYLVGSPSPDNPSFPILAETELYTPQYIKATDVPKLMSKYYTPYIQVSKETNTVSLTGSPEMIAYMKQDLAKVDYPPRQVMIEALVTEISTDVDQALGITWSAEASKDDADIGMHLYPPTGVVPDSTFGIGFQRVGIKSNAWVGQFQMRLSALIIEGKARVRANPRVATLEGQQARIFVGREEYFTIVTGQVTFAYAQLEVIKTGVSLTITPYVSDEGFITLEVEPSVSDVIGSGSTGLPITSKRSVTTKVRISEGETVVIGGLYVQTEMEVVRKVPLLGSIPILGALFRQTVKNKVESEVTVLITPYLWEPENMGGQ